MVGFCTYMQVFAYIRKQEGNLEKLLKTLENTINKEIGFVAQLDTCLPAGREHQTSDLRVGGSNLNLKKLKCGLCM